MVKIHKITYITQIIYIIQLCSGITRGRVLNEKLYAQRFQIN